MKMTKIVKRGLLATALLVGSLGAMSFTAVKTGAVCVKQQITLTDGSAITAYYVQEDGTYALYSTANPAKYKPADLYRIKDSHFSTALGYEGKCLYRAESLQEALDMANALFKMVKPAN